MSTPIMDHSRVQRPISRRNGRPIIPAILPPPVKLKGSYEWQKWNELTVKVRGLMPHETTYSIWKNFRGEGNIVFIELYEGRNGQREGGAKLRFSPPPEDPFWTRNGPLGTYPMNMDGHLKSYNVYVAVDNKRGGTKIQSPTRRFTWYEPKMKLFSSALHFGIMISPKSMMPLNTVIGRKKDDLTFVIDLLRNRLVGSFSVTFEDPHPTGVASGVNEFNRTNRYMFQIPFGQLVKIYRMEINPDVFALVISLESPPQFYRKREDQRLGHSDETLIWSEFDTWYRQTDIVFNPYALQTAKVALHKDKPVIDIGRWTTYMFEFANILNDAELYNTMKQALQDFNIEIISVDCFTKEPPRPAELWSLIDPPKSNRASADLKYLAQGDCAIALPFEVRYQLEVCISRENINEYNVTKPCIQKLAEISSQDPTKARNILEHVASREKRIFDPMSIFTDTEALAFSAKTEVPHYCAYVRKATVTPTTIYFSSPTVETTNRVLRHYARENQDGRFLRVQFTDEMFEGRINSCAEKQRNDELFTRVYRTIFNGIQIGDRHFEFLAFGNSQFRENGAYFFCPTDHLSCADIRQWMGNFSHIGVVAKYAARLGQCFSTTRAINGLSKPDIVIIPDVEKNGHCFTDGVGKISAFLAQMITAELGVRANTPPSAFQFRLGGCKGILVVWPEAKNREVHIRKSQQKFTAVYNGLEIIRCSRFSHVTLNRQTITILSSLGVPDDVFINMLSEQLENYQSAMSNDDLAVSLLLRYIDDNQMTINIAAMIRNGFMAKRDPFVMSLLHLWRAWSIKLLKEKAKIIVEDGAFVLGCIDETGALRGYKKQKTDRGEQLTEEELPQIFIQVPEKADPSRYNVIEGICLVGRNPSLHPGDLRVVQAVNIPALHHLRDVVVFPINGDRDIPSMCSGGDLDGDDFFVIWDKQLRPPEVNCEPMNYTAPSPKNSNRPVEITDLMKFFVRFMKNDSLPTIAHAHLAQSDFLENGVKDSKCLELAALHSKAVDYVKTGEPAQMLKRLRPSKWPHFMEKKFKPKDAQYTSRKILGLLYDRVEMVNFTAQYEEPFDRRILNAYALEDSVLKIARQTKSQYDTAMRRLMAQQEVKTEFEIWSTFVLSRPRVGSDYKLQEEIARLSDALKDQFRAICIERAGSKDFSVLGPFIAAMYKVTKEELDIALVECRTMKMYHGVEIPKRKMEPKSMPLISFPWIFEKELGRIATGIDASESLDDLRIAPIIFNESGHFRKKVRSIEVDAEDYIQRKDGVIVHRGEELDLFRHVDSDDSVNGDDYDEAQQFKDEHGSTRAESGEVVMPIHSAEANRVHDSMQPPSLYFDTWQEEQSTSIRQPSLIDDSEQVFSKNSHTRVSISPSLNDLADLDLSATSIEAGTDGDMVEEAVTLKDSKSAKPALEKIAGLLHEKHEDDFEELVHFETKESPLDRLSCMAGP